jgi:hypothetical protein
VCGHSCLGGSCTNGLCPTIILATNQGGSQGITLDDDNVYWTNSYTGQVMACAKSGCNDAPIALVSNSAMFFPQSLLIQNDLVYYTVFATPGEVMSCATTGCSDNPSTFIGGQAQPGSLAVDSANLYWWDTSGTISACPLTGCAEDGGYPRLLVSNRPGLQGWDVMAVNATNVYWCEDTGVFSCPLAGCTNQPALIAPVQECFALVIDSQNVYWSDQVAQTIEKCPLTGCTTPILVANAQGQPANLVVDSSFVYWTTGPSASLVLKCPLSGCGDNPILLAADQSFPVRIAVDDQRIYWTDYGGAGTIVSVPK